MKAFEKIGVFTVVSTLIGAGVVAGASIQTKINSNMEKIEKDEIERKRVRELERKADELDSIREKEEEEKERKLRHLEDLERKLAFAEKELAKRSKEK